MCGDLFTAVHGSAFIVLSLRDPVGAHLYQVGGNSATDF